MGKYGKIPKTASRHRWCFEDALWVAFCPLETQFQPATMLLLWWTLKDNFKTPFGNGDAWPRMTQILFLTPLLSIILVCHLLVIYDVSSIALSLPFQTADNSQLCYHITSMGKSEYVNKLSKTFDLPSAFSLCSLCTPYAQIMTLMLLSFPLL